MTYLPGLRDSLVRAARERAVEVAMPQVQRPRRGPRWLTAGGLATTLAVATAIAVAVVAVLALGHRPARTAAASTPGVSRSDLRHAAFQALDRIALPPGAVASGLVPGTPAELWSPSSRLGISHAVDVYRVWRIHERPDRVIQFLESHAPASSFGGFESESGGSQKPGGPAIVLQATGSIGLVSTRRGIWRQLALNAAALSGGWTALRVDSQAGWLAPRPASELIPRGVSRVVIKWNGRKSPIGGSLTIANLARVKKLVSAVNSLAAATGTCRTAPKAFITVVFEGARGHATSAVVTYGPPCRNLELFLRARPVVPLSIGSPNAAIGMQFFAQIDELLLPLVRPTRVSSSKTTLHSAKRCESSQHSSPAVSPSAPGAAVVLCTSVRSSTTTASAH